MTRPVGSIKNVVWIILDGVRNYQTPRDPEKMGKPPFLDEIAKTGVEFTQTVTSATSTLMSVTAMMTSLPAYYLSRNLSDLSIDKSYFESLGSILEAERLNVFSIPISYEMRRDYWQGFLRPVPHRFVPRGYHRMEHWSNEPLNPIVFRLLEEGLLDKPFFLYVHYNARRDVDVAARCQVLLSRLQSAGKMDDTILVIASDHGMPDPERRDFYGWLRERGLYFNRHDLILTDDNILVPFVMCYPGAPHGKKVETTVGTIDITPTILDLMGIEYGVGKKYGASFRGTSLLPLIRGECIDWYSQRKIRTDTRYIAQADRMISIRGTGSKYVFFRDIPGSDKEQFFDLCNDLLETQNLIHSNDDNIRELIAHYKRYLQETEEDAIKFQVEYLSRKFTRLMKQRIGEPMGAVSKVLVIASCNVGFLRLLRDVLEYCFPGRRFDVLLERDYYNNDLTLNSLGYRNHIFAHSKFSFPQFSKDYKNVMEQYDLLIVPVTDYKDDFDQARQKSTEGSMALIQPPKPMSVRMLKDLDDVIRIAGCIRTSHRVFIDYNLDIHKHPRRMVVRRYITKMVAKSDIYVEKPGELLKDVRRLVFGT